MTKKLHPKRDALLEFIKNHPLFSSREIHEGADLDLSYATIKRILQELVNEKLVEISGVGKATRYSLTQHEILRAVNVEEYFKKEVDDRKIKSGFDHSVIEELKQISIFTEEEYAHLAELQNKHRATISGLSEHEYNKDLEHLAIDLSWKSSQIEGNTYSLLETEILLKEKQTASGKTKDEAVMLLNHKEALDFIIADPSYVIPLTVARIEDIHSILMKELRVGKNIRKRAVSISGTNYKPLDNEYQIKEAMEEMCALVNQKENVFEKALLTLVLLSYIQAFTDGNKRTARIISNAVLISNNYCPISFRTVDSLDYKKAMLLFYEQNNITAIKRIFIGQFEFAVQTYF
jgi:Fic family protein